MNLLITGAWNCSHKQIEEIESLGFTVTYLQEEKDNLPCNYEWVEGVICNGLFLSHPIEKFTNLKFIQLTSAGYDRVPMDYIKKSNIKIFNAKGVYSIPMAEFAISGVLDLYKCKREIFNNQEYHNWAKFRDLQELEGKTVCIVGCGNVGQECAKRFRAFDCNVIGVDIVSFKNEHFEKIYLLKNIKEAVRVSDVVVLTLPLTNETKYLFDNAMFKLMKSDAIFVNIARGKIVKEIDLICALDNIGGAVLDVFEEEPLFQESPLWNKKNVIISSHNSFVGEGNEIRLLNVIKRNLESLI